MDIEKIEKNLKKLSDKEKIYQKYQEAEGDPEKLRKLKESVGEEYVRQNRLILPDLYPEACPQRDAFSERDWAFPTRDVTLFKHDCFQPSCPHRHSCFEVVCVLSGSCTQVLKEQRLPLKQGDICFFPPGSCHSTEVRDESVVLNILIRQRTLEDIFFRLFRHQSVLSSFFAQSLYGSRRYIHVIFPTGQDPEVRRMLLEMMGECQEEDEFCGDVLVHRLALFFIHLVRHYGNQVVVPEIPEPTAKEEADILNYLRDNYRTATLSRAAEHFHYTESYCSKFIKDVTGQNFVSLLREIRLQRAEQLLANTDISVEELADELGYDNAETLIKVFKQSRHMTPGQYRRYVAQSRTEGR